MISLILLIVGLSLLLWRERVARALRRFQGPQFRRFFGSAMDSESATIVRFYEWWVTAVAIFLLIGSFATCFGPIQL